MIRIAGKKRQRFVLRALCAIALWTVCTMAAQPLSAQSKASTFKDVADKPPAGWTLAGSKPENYGAGIDGQAVFEDKPSAYLKATVADTGGFGTLMQSFSAERYLGKRIRLHAWVKTMNASGWAGLWMRVDQGSVPISFDNMESRPIRNTTGWTSYDVVLDVPAGSTGIAFGLMLTGPGEVWMSGLKLETVGPEVAITGVPKPSGPVNLEFQK